MVKSKIVGDALEAHRLRDRLRLFRQRLSRPRRSRSASRLYLWSKARRLRPHQARTAARSAIEPVIGHMKIDGHLGRCHFEKAARATPQTSHSPPSATIFGAFSAEGSAAPDPASLYGRYSPPSGSQQRDRSMVASGWAVAYRRYSLYYLHEDAAQRNIWSDDFDMPWDWRASDRTDDVTIAMKPQPEPSAQEVLAGLVERVTYHNAENGFCVLRAKARGHRDVVTVVGHSATIAAGEWITASGDGSTTAPMASSLKQSFCALHCPIRPTASKNISRAVVGKRSLQWVQTRTSSLGAARQLPPSADVGPGGQFVGRASRLLLRFSRLTNGCAWNAVSAFANCGRAVAHVRGKLCVDFV